MTKSVKSVDSVSDDPVSAQVSLSAAGAADPQPVIEALQSAGFTTGRPFANNFSITATRRSFVDFFDVEIDVSSSGTRVRNRSGEAAYELPLSAMPPEIRDKIASIVFTRRDF